MNSDNNTPIKKELNLNKAIVPLSNLIEKYPLFFLEFQDTYPEITKWDKHFILDSELNPPLTLRQFFAQHGYFMEIKKTALIKVNTTEGIKKSEKAKLEATKFTIKIRKDNKLDQTIFVESGDITLLIKAVTFCIEKIDKDLSEKE